MMPPPDSTTLEVSPVARTRQKARLHPNSECAAKAPRRWAKRCHVSVAVAGSGAWNLHPLPHQESVGQRIAFVDQPGAVSADERTPFDLGNHCLEFTAFSLAQHAAPEDRSDDRLVH